MPKLLTIFRPSTRLRKLAWGLIIILALGMVALRLYLTDARITEIAQAQLNKTLSGRFSVQQLRLHGLSEVELVGLSIHAPKSPHSTPALEVKKARVQLRLWSLLGRVLEVQRLEIQGLSVRVRKNGGPEFGLLQAIAPKTPSPPEPDAEPSSIRVLVQKADVHFQELYFSDDQREVQSEGGAISGIRMDLLGSSLSLQLGLHLPKVRVEAEGVQTESLALQIQGVHLKSELDAGEHDAALKALELFTGHSSISLSANAKAARNLPTQIRAKLRAPLALDDPLIQTVMGPAQFKQLGLGGRARVELDADLDIAKLRGKFALRTSSEGAKVLGQPLRELRAEGAYHGKALRLVSAQLALGGSRIELKGRIFPAVEGLPIAITARLVKLMPQELGASFVSLELLPKELTGELGFEGRAHPPRGKAHADLQIDGLPKVAAKGMPQRATVNMRAALKERIELSQLTLSAGALSVNANGQIPLKPSSAVKLDFSVDHGSPSALMAAYGAPLHASRFSAKGQVTGALNDPRVEAKIEAGGLELDASPGASMKLKAEVGFAHQLASVKALRLSVGEGLLQAQGRFNIATQTASVTAALNRIPLGALSGGKISGRLDGRLGVEGPLSAPRGGGALSVQGLAITEQRFRTAKLKFLLGDRSVYLDDLRLEPQIGGHLRGRGQMSLDGESLQGRLRLLDFELGGLSADIGGLASGEAKVWGSTKAPKFEADFKVEGLQAQSRAQGDISLRAFGDLQKVQAKIQVAHPAGPLSLGAELSPKAQTVDARLLGADLDLSKILTAAGAQVPASGRAKIDVRVKGPLTAPRIEGGVKARLLSLQDKVVDTTVALKVRTSSAAKVSYLGSFEALERIRGQFTLQPPLDGRALSAKARIDLLGFNPARWIPQLSGQGLGMDLAGRIDVGYDQRGPRAKVELHRVAGRLQEASFVAEGPLVASYEKGKINLAPVVLDSGAGKLKLSAVMDKTLVAQAEGGVDIKLLVPFVPALSHGSGAVRLEAKVTGTPEKPEIRGRVLIQKSVSVRPRGMVREMEISKGEIELQPDRVQVRSLEGVYGGGAFSARGLIRLAGLAPESFALKLAGDNLAFSTKEAAVEANVRLAISGAAKSPKVTGRVDILRARYLREVELKDFNFVSKDEDVGPPLAERVPFLEHVSLNLRAVSDNVLDVKVDAGVLGMALVFGTDLRITGSAARPKIDGRVEASGGSITFPKGKLNITSAAVELESEAVTGEELAVKMDIQAEGEVDAEVGGQKTSYLVTMNLEGDMNELRLNLSSDPNLERMEVLTLLITGTTVVQELVAGEERGNQEMLDAALAFAGAQLVGPVADYVEDKLEEYLNLDLDLGAELSDESFKIKVSKSIARRLVLEGVHDRSLTEQRATTSAGARFLLFDSFFFEGTASTQTGEVFGSSTLLDRTQGRFELKMRLLGN